MHELNDYSLGEVKLPVDETPYMLRRAARVPLIEELGGANVDAPLPVPPET